MSTLKQRRVAKLVANGSSMKEVMVEAGYSPRTARAPTKLTKSKGWNELLDKYLPDEEVFEVHSKGLRATKTISALVMVKQEDGKELVYKNNEGVIEVDDTPTQLRAVELAYKVKRKLQDSPMSPGTVQINFNANKYVRDR